MADDSANNDEITDMVENESYLENLFTSFIRQDYEYYEVILNFSRYLDNLLSANPNDKEVSALTSALGEVIKSGSTEILNYVNNAYFEHFFQTNQTAIDNITQKFNIRFKFWKGKLSICPFVSDNQITFVSNDAKRRLVSAENSQNPKINTPVQDQAGTHVPPLPPGQDSITPVAGNSATNSTPNPQPKFYNVFYELSENYKEVLEHFTTKCPGLKAKVTGELIKLTTSNPDHYRFIQNDLEKNKIAFRTLDPRSERPRKVLLRGMPVTTDVEDIRAALVKMELEPLFIAHLKSRKPSDKGKILPLFVITLKATANFEEVYKLDFINHLKVRVVRFTPQTYRQCYNCQAYGHSSFTCKLRPKCLKCSLNHSSKNCTIKTKEQLKCANCQGNHPANYHGCPQHPANRTNQSSKAPAPHKTAQRGPQPKAVPPTGRYFIPPTANPWDPLAKLDSQQTDTDTTSAPSTSTGNPQNATKTQGKRKYPIGYNPVPPTKNQKQNKNPPKDKNPQKDSSTRETPKQSENSFQEFFTIFKQVREFMQDYNLSDIFSLFKTAMNILKNPELEFIDKLASIFSLIGDYCNPPTSHG